MSRSAAMRFGALAALLLVLGVILVVAGVPAPGAVAGMVGATGLPVPLVAVTGAAVLILGLVPRTLLATAAGLLFGPVAGAAYVIAGATAGGLLAFGVGRWLGRDFVAAQARVAGLDRWLIRRGMLGVVTVRLLPLAPFGMVSYAFGTSGVRLWAFGAGTVVGMLPTTLVYVNLGAHATRPGSFGFWISVTAAVLLWGATMSATTWLGRRRSHIAGAASGSWALR